MEQLSLISFCLIILDRSLRLALTTRERIPLSNGGWSDDDCSVVSEVFLVENLVGSNVTTPPDCAPLIMVTLTCMVMSIQKQSQ